MKRTFIIIFAIISLAGCTKMLDVNNDPATPQITEAHLLFPPILAQMERGVAGDARYLARYIQAFTLNTTADMYDRHGYARNSDLMGEMWRTTYFGVGGNLRLVLEDAHKNKKYDFVGAAMAIRAWCWQTTTDYHGEIILKQAFDSSRYVFEYDSQEDVYKEVVRLCTEALPYLDNTEGGTSVTTRFTQGDLVYGGNRTKWKRFINGILARNGQNLANKAIYDPAKVIEYVDSALTGNADNFLIPNLGTNSDNGNNYGPSKFTNAAPSLSNAYIQSRMIANLLNGTILGGGIDPRAPLMITASPDSVYRGATPAGGDPARNTTSTTLQRTEIPNLYGIKGTPVQGGGKFIFTDASPFAIMTYAEMQFIKAEAAFKSNKPTLAYEAFKKGITAHMDFVKVPAAQRDAYLLSVAVPQTEAALTLKDILLQKYIALWGVGVQETWCDMRRYHYDTTLYKGYTILPVGNITLFEDNLGKLAYRVRPRFNSEYAWNMEALKKIGADKIDYHTVEMWFTKP